MDNARNEGVIADVRHWVEALVIGLNLCPFAKRELAKERLRFAVTTAADAFDLLAVLEEELKLLAENPAIETTLLIHPMALLDFASYNQFLNLADRLVAQLKFRGVFQIASFHPDYRFEGTNAEDIENYTNKAPYPMLHLLREESLAQAIANYPDADKIPERNVALLASMGREALEKLLNNRQGKAPGD